MLDKVRKALLPSTLKTELDQIEAELPPLEAEVEAARLALGDLHTQMAQGAVNAPTERHLRAAAAHHEELRLQVKSLRSRRRELLDLLAPPSPVREKLADLKKPPALRSAEEALEVARASRQALIRRGVSDATRGAELEAFNADLRGLEAQISALRERRAELLEPWYEEIRRELRPMEVDLAKRLQAAAREFIETVSLFTEVAASKPPAAPGLGNGLEHIVHLSTLPAHQALEYAGRVLEIWVGGPDSK